MSGLIPDTRCSNDACFANRDMNCTILTNTDFGTRKCSFFKRHRRDKIEGKIDAGGGEPENRGTDDAGGRVPECD